LRLNINKFCLYNFVQQAEILSTNCFNFCRKCCEKAKKLTSSGWQASDAAFWAQQAGNRNKQSASRQWQCRQWL